MTEQITAKRALELLERVVKREGRATVRPCRYVDTTYDKGTGREVPVPVCIVAHVAVEAGVSIDEIVKWGASSLGGLDEDDRLDDVMDLSNDALCILVAAQRAQDQGNSRGVRMWGHALAGARRVAWQRGVRLHPRKDAA